jgi:hypothetical protein
MCMNVRASIGARSLEAIPKKNLSVLFRTALKKRPFRRYYFADCWSNQLRSGVMTKAADSPIARRYREIGSLLAICLGTLVVCTEPAWAFSFDETIQRCRQAVGRPIVEACLAGRHASTPALRKSALPACRTQASPRVRACVQRAMIVAYGWPKVEGVIERCRQSVGRPAVNACMTSGASPQGVPDLEACRQRAAPQVRACVRQTLNQAG